MPKIQEMKSSPKNGKKSSYHTIAIPRTWMKIYGWKKGMELVFLPGKEEKSLLLKEMPREVKE